jgi:replicative DNA helicase
MEQEQQLLGSILRNPPTFEMIKSILCLHDFAEERHRLIFEAMEEIENYECHEDGITPGNVVSHMGNTNTITGVDGGAGYIWKLYYDQESVVCPCCQETLSRELRDKAVLRGLQMTSLLDEGINDASSEHDS